MNALRLTMLQKSESEPYTRVLRTEWLMPIQIGGRCRFKAPARVQSSINAPRIDVKPPASTSAEARNSTQPPAAAAIGEERRLTARNG